MADCFISYSSVDEQLAKFVAQQLRAQGLDPFMASLSLQPGQDWSREIKRKLIDSPWVIFLASRAASLSPFVQQEVGGAIFGSKKLVPVVWDMAPSELPGWAQHFQALDLRGATVAQIGSQILSIAKQIKADKDKGVLIAGALLVGLIWLASRE